MNNRKTYLDNNGFLRYEDNCKLCHNQPDQKEVLSEMYRIFAKPHLDPSITILTDYENKIMERQEQQEIDDEI